jgi:hypothetical protein
VGYGAFVSDEGPRRLPWPIRNDDLGVRIVDQIGHALTRDLEWSVRTERGFTWWEKDLAQGVWAEPSFWDDGFEIFRLHARTDLLRDFEASDENLEILDRLALVATLSGYLVDAEAGTVELAASMYVHANTEDWVKATFQNAVAIQAADAQLKSELLAEMTHSTVAVSGHPISGRRELADDMLLVLEQFVVPSGREPSVWEGEEMEWITTMVQQAGYTVMATGDETGLSAEFPFQSRTSLLTISTEETNPQLGNGALLILKLPMQFEQTPGIRFALELNRREVNSRTNTHFLGSWCWAHDTLCHVSFLPNAVRYGRGDLLNLVASMTGRAKWIAETFYGDDWERNRDAGQPLATPAALDVPFARSKDPVEEQQVDGELLMSQRERREPGPRGEAPRNPTEPNGGRVPKRRPLGAFLAVVLAGFGIAGAVFFDKVLHLGSAQVWVLSKHQGWGSAYSPSGSYHAVAARAAWQLPASIGIATAAVALAILVLSGAKRRSEASPHQRERSGGSSLYDASRE